MSQRSDPSGEPGSLSSTFCGASHFGHLSGKRDIGNPLLQSVFLSRIFPQAHIFTMPHASRLGGLLKRPLASRHFICVLMAPQNHRPEHNTGEAQ